MSSILWIDVMPGEPKKPDPNDLRLLSLPRTIAPVVPSPPYQRRRPRRNPSMTELLMPAMPELAVAGLGLVATISALILAGAIWSQTTEMVDSDAMLTNAPALPPIERPALPAALPVPGVDRAQTQ